MMEPGPGSEPLVLWELPWGWGPGPTLDVLRVGH